MTETATFYRTTGTPTYYDLEVKCKEIAKELTKVKFSVNNYGISKYQQDTKDSVTIINDFKKQEKRFFIHGDILATPDVGSTAWQNQYHMAELFEAGGTYMLNLGSEGTFEGLVTKYKFTKRDVIDKYEATIEFLCGVSRS